MNWFRWYHGTVNDPKLLVVARLSGEPKAIVLAVWQTILECASQNDDRGSLDGYDADDISAALDIEASRIVTICHAMSQKKMIGDGYVSNWEKRQPKREDSTAAERQQKKRERDKLREEIADLKEKLEYVTQCHAASRSVTTEERRGEEKREDIKAAAELSTPVVIPPVDELPAAAKAGGENKNPEKPMNVSDVQSLSARYLGKLTSSAGEVTTIQRLLAKYPTARIVAAFEAAGAAGATHLTWVVKRLDDPRGGTARASPGHGLSADEVELENREIARRFCGVGGEA